MFIPVSLVRSPGIPATGHFDRLAAFDAGSASGSGSGWPQCRQRRESARVERLQDEQYVCLIGVVLSFGVMIASLSAHERASPFMVGVRP
jgi:hypothetical protein